MSHRKGGGQLGITGWLQTAHHEVLVVELKGLLAGEMAQPLKAGLTTKIEGMARHLRHAMTNNLHKLKFSEPDFLISTGSRKAQDTWLNI